MHYICKGSCNGISDHQQNCDAESCNMYDHPLTPCSCTDGEHKEAKENHEQTNA